LSFKNTTNHQNIEELSTEIAKLQTNIKYREENIFDQENEYKRLQDEIENIIIETDSLDNELTNHKCQKESAFDQLNQAIEEISSIQLNIQLYQSYINDKQEKIGKIDLQSTQLKINELKLSEQDYINKISLINDEIDENLKVSEKLRNEHLKLSDQKSKT